MAMTPIPVLDRTSATFKADVDTFFGSRLPAFAAEANALQSDVTAKQEAASSAASAAATKASAASTSASAAAQSKTDAETARDAAVTAKDAAEAAFDSFDDRYLGAKAEAPTLDNDGSPLLTAALYWDTSLGMRGWNGSAWITLPAATKAAVGLGNVDNTADADKPVSASQALADAAAKDRANHTGALNFLWAAYSGTANAVTLAPAYARASYVRGDALRFRATATNTGATTIQVGALGALPAVTITGAALPAGYIRTDVDTVCVYDGTKFVVEREIESGSSASGLYFRSACGLQICTGTGTALTANAAFGALFGSNGSVATYASAFSAPPKVCPTNNSTGGWALAVTSNNATVDLFAVSPISGTSITPQYIAIGRWY